VVTRLVCPFERLGYRIRVIEIEQQIGPVPGDRARFQASGSKYGLR
jgi:hypothetical protein